MKKNIDLNELFLNLSKRKEYLDKLFYKGLIEENKIRKKVILDLTLKLNTIKRKVDVLMYFEVSFNKLYESIEFLEEEILLMKREQQRITRAINEKKIKYIDYLIPFLDYTKENLETECCFYSEEYYLFVKKYDEIYYSTIKKLEELEKFLNKEYKKLPEKNIKHR